MAGVNPAGPLRFHYLIKHHSTLNRANTRRSGVGTCIHFSASYKSAYTLGFRTSKGRIIQRIKSSGSISFPGLLQVWKSVKETGEESEKLKIQARNWIARKILFPRCYYKVITHLIFANITSVFFCKCLTTRKTSKWRKIRFFGVLGIFCKYEKIK